MKYSAAFFAFACFTLRATAERPSASHTMALQPSGTLHSHNVREHNIAYNLSTGRMSMKELMNWPVDDWKGSQGQLLQIDEKSLNSGVLNDTSPAVRNSAGEICLAEIAFDGSVDDTLETCRGGDPPGSKPCTACIEHQWRTSLRVKGKLMASGEGYKCCAQLHSDEAALQPLCGLCARLKADPVGGKGLAGPAEYKSDQSNFFECAKVYCAFAEGPGSRALLEQIKDKCAPENTGYKKVKQTHMSAIVANNPEKYALAEFLKTSDNTQVVQREVTTGTASSSTMAQCITGAAGAKFTTESGPWGGDAQLAWALAAQAIDGTPYIDDVIFFSNEKEAHRLDILALKNILVQTMCTARGAHPCIGKVAFNPAQAVAVLNAARTRN
jgi:methylglyoxal synthase